MSVEISNDKLLVMHLRKAVEYIRTDTGTNLEETARVLNKFADLKQGYMDLAEAEHEKFVTQAKEYSWSDYKMEAVEKAERENS
jgi:hypothetical protein|tara:strand:- start:549 stop:800 length:252 start_codon:yes stop_codon:yes gene_type:complete